MGLQVKRHYFTVVISSYVIIEKDNKVLFSRRHNTGYHDGDYSLPAGHIEEAEFATAAAIREAEEEVNITIKPEHLVPVHIMHRHCGDHERIDFFFTTQKWTGDIKNKEPERCDKLDWFTPSDIPENIIPYIKSALLHIQADNFFSEFTEEDNKVLNK